MLRITFLLLFASLAVSTVAQEIRYPETRQGETVDDYHGTRVADPYRWLETLDSDETEAWITAQNEVAEPYLDNLLERTYFLNRLQALQEAVPPGVVRKQGPYWVTQTRRPDGSRVFFVQDDLDAPKRLLLDPAVLFPDEEVTVEFVQVSPDGHYAAYSVGPGGTRLMEVRIRDLEQDRDLRISARRHRRRSIATARRGQSKSPSSMTRGSRGSRRAGFSLLPTSGVGVSTARPGARRGGSGRSRTRTTWPPRSATASSA